MMTRKDYVAIAQIINNYFDKADHHDALVANVHDFLIDPFIDLLANDNPNFDKEKFWDACTENHF